MKVSKIELQLLQQKITICDAEVECEGLEALLASRVSHHRAVLRLTIITERGLSIAPLQHVQTLAAWDEKAAAEAPYFVDPSDS